MDLLNARIMEASCNLINVKPNSSKIQMPIYKNNEKVVNNLYKEKISKSI